MDDLSSLIGKDIIYTSKGQHKPRKAKIRQINTDRKNNKVNLDVEVEKDRSNKKGNFKFVTGFKGAKKDIIDEMNAYINISKKTDTRPDINRQEIYRKIERIINQEETKVIKLQPIEFGEKKAAI